MISSVNDKDHADLIERARKWLARPQSDRGACTVILTEVSTGYGEIPDALGWYGVGSYLVECKATRPDYLRDVAKRFRRNPWMGMGLYRYYLADENVIPGDGHELGDWGLLRPVRRSAVQVVKLARPQTINFSAEVDVLLSTLRRLHIQPDGHTSIKYYVYPTKSTATLTRPELGTGCDE